MCRDYLHFPPLLSFSAVGARYYDINQLVNDMYDDWNGFLVFRNTVGLFYISE